MGCVQRPELRLAAKSTLMLRDFTLGSPLSALTEIRQYLCHAGETMSAALHGPRSPQLSGMGQHHLPQTAFFYGAQVPAAALAKFDRVVVEAEQIKDLHPLRVDGADIFAYVSVGEAEGWRASTRALPQEFFLGSNAAWHSRVADLTHPGWRRFLLNQRMDGLWAAGYRAFFLDTLDSYRMVIKDASQDRAQSAALVDLIRAIHDRFPGIKLLLNRGFEVLPEVAPLCVGIVAESLFQGWNSGLQAYVCVSNPDRRWLLRRLNDARQRFGLPVTVIDYVSPDQSALAHETAQRISALGFIPWVANPGLDILPA
jgi:hypothetical protein